MLSEDQERAIDLVSQTCTERAIPDHVSPVFDQSLFAKLSWGSHTQNGSYVEYIVSTDNVPSSHKNRM